MDHHLNAQRTHNNELGFNTTRMTFIFGNSATLAINAFADLDSASKMALSAFVVILNIASLLSFDTELKTFAALTKDNGDDSSAYASTGKENPWTAFRIFCVLICVVAAVTQWMAINA
jgi:hypothetical protein